MQMQLKCHNGTIIILNEDEQAEVYEFYRLHQTMERLKEVLTEKKMLNTFKSEAALTTVAKRVLELKDDYHVSEDNAIETVFEDTDYIETYLTKDMGEAISARIQQALENDEDELNFYMEMLENGIDVEMVRKFVSDEAADHMQEFCEEHGLLDDKNEVIYDEGWDAYVCPTCGAYIVDRNTAKYTDYIPPKNCSQCGCEIKF